METTFGNEVPVYDMERTVCDVIRNRSNIEMQVFQDTLKRYVKRKDKNLRRLMQYAKADTKVIGTLGLMMKRNHCAIMKKFFVAVALVMGLGTTVAFAENLTSGVETVMAVNDFTPIEVKDLPAAVTEAIAKNFAESTVKEAAVEAAEDGSKTYQVVLTDKEGAESTVFFNEKGEILK